MTALAPVLNPHGALSLKPSNDAAPLDDVRSARLQQAFARGSGHGLLSLGADEVGTNPAPSLAYWREFAARYVTALCALPGLGEDVRKSAVSDPVNEALEAFAGGIPPMVGAEHLTASILAELWRSTDAAFDVELRDSGASVQDFLKSRHPASPPARTKRTRS